MYRIAITNRQSALLLDRPALRRIAREVLEHAGIANAEISLVFVGDGEMHALNRRHLAHDYPTDVLSFLLDASTTGDRRSIDAEVVVSTEYAARTAPQFGWTAQNETTLYVVHGLLHACGYDDLTPREKSRMRRVERTLLQRAGLQVRYRGRQWQRDTRRDRKSTKTTAMKPSRSSALRRRG